MPIYPNMDKLVLASASPRRRELLSLLGVSFSVQVPEVEETHITGEAPRAFAERLAAEKANDISSTPETTVIAADTIVVQDHAILGKPSSKEQAFAMLSGLSGNMHAVLTGVCIKRDSRLVVFSVSTTVVFRTLTVKEIAEYVDTGCPMDKAGGYAIQGGAAHMVRAIRGSYTNVVGLPLCELHEALISF